MSDISIPLPYRASETPSSSKSAPLGLRATLGWGALGIIALMITWLLAILPQALWGTRLASLPVLDLLPTGHIAVIVVVAAALWACRRSFREYLAVETLRWRDVGRGVGYGLLSYVGTMIVAVIIMLLLSALGVDVPPAALPILEMPLNDQTLPILLSLWVGLVVAAPIAEELLFRGLLYRGLAESRLGAFGAIALTSVVFGLVHAPGFGWPRVVVTGCAGLLFGWLRWRTGSTSVCIVAHATSNLVAATILTALILSR